VQKETTEISAKKLTISIAPGSYKGTIISQMAAGCMETAVRRVFPNAYVNVIPLADGGEGTLEIIQQHCGGEMNTSIVLNAYGRRVRARWLKVRDCAIIQTSEAIGLSMLKSSERDPIQSSSFGVGELIQKAIYSDFKRIMVCMGDSATTDVGIGMLSALGARFFNNKGERLEPTVLSMSKLAHINIDHFNKRIKETEFIGLADTSNSLCGNEGHVSVYGEQKGLKSRDLQMLSQNFDRIGSVMEDQFGAPIRNTPYTSPSGGIAAAIKAVLRGRIIPTLDYLDSLISFRESLMNSSVVITGEGRLDRSSKYGKVPYVVANSTKGLCLLILGGYTQEGQDDFREFDHVELFCLPLQGVNYLDVDMCKVITDTTQFALGMLSEKKKITFLKTKDDISA